MRIRPKRKATSAEVAYALGRADALREAWGLAAVWEAKGANAGAVRIVLMGRAAQAFDEYHDLVPLESAEEDTPCKPQSSSAVSSGLRAPGQEVAAQPAQKTGPGEGGQTGGVEGSVLERDPEVAGARIIQLEDRRVGYSMKVPPA